MRFMLSYGFSSVIAPLLAFDCDRLQSVLPDITHGLSSPRNTHLRMDVEKFECVFDRLVYS